MLMHLLVVVVARERERSHAHAQSLSTHTHAHTHSPTGCAENEANTQNDCYHPPSAAANGCAKVRVCVLLANFFATPQKAHKTRKLQHKLKCVCHIHILYIYVFFFSSSFLCSVPRATVRTFQLKWQTRMRLSFVVAADTGGCLCVCVGVCVGR